MTKIITYIHDVIDSVVDAMRETSTILSFTDNTDNTYTVAVSSLESLINGDYVTISGTTNFNGDNYLISNIDSINLTFDISKTSGLLTETGVWTANKPYHIFSHWQVLANKIIEKNQSSTFKYQKYPLIFLPDDIQYKYNGEPLENDDYTCDLSLFFMDHIDFGRTANLPETQYSQVIQAKLIPLVTSFQTNILSQKSIKNRYKINFTQQIHTNFGVKERYGNGANLLPDWLACIELNFTVTVYKNYSC